MPNTSKIQFLVPVDFSDQSLIALEQACNLAKVYQAEIDLLYVQEEQGVISKIFSGKLGENASMSFEKSMRILAKDTAAKTGLRVGVLIEKGNVSEKIVEKAETLNSTMIVMGIMGTASGITKKGIGFNATRIVQQAKCQVVTIRGKHHRKGCANIILPLDLTKTTTKKLENSIEMAYLFKGTTIRIVSVLLTTDEKVINHLTKQIAQVRDYIESKDIDCTAEIIKIIKGEETLAKAIIDYANKVEGDLIMIMTQQERKIKKLFIGSSAKEIIHYSDIPVMSIVPK